MRSSVIQRIYVVDDHPIVRQGLCHLFDREPDFEICGDAAGVGEALAGIPTARPDLVVSDLTLEGSSGLELVKSLVRHHPEIRVLILSMHDEELYAERALAAGAQGYVMKRHAEGEILHAAREVLAGRAYLSDTLRDRLAAQRLPDEKPGRSPVETLTDRELEVFRLIGQGYAPRHIADRLHLSVSTVEVYRERLKEKLHLDSSALLTRYAVRWSKDHEAD